VRPRPRPARTLGASVRTHHVPADASVTPGNFKKDATVRPSHGRPRGHRPSVIVRVTILLCIKVQDLSADLEELRLKKSKNHNLPNQQRMKPRTRPDA
jgi:hypothetical protein